MRKFRLKIFCLFKKSIEIKVKLELLHGGAKCSQYLKCNVNKHCRSYILAISLLKKSHPATAAETEVSIFLVLEHLIYKIKATWLLR